LADRRSHKYSLPIKEKYKRPLFSVKELGGKG